jgi:hypothetical protein
MRSRSARPVSGAASTTLNAGEPDFACDNASAILFLCNARSNGVELINRDALIQFLTKKLIHNEGRPLHIKMVSNSLATETDTGT